MAAQTWPEALDEREQQSRAAGLIERVRGFEHGQALGLILGAKLLTALLIAFAAAFIPLNQKEREANFVYPQGAVTAASRFTTWDSAHYLYLAEQGYKPDQMSNAFSPLYPLALRGVKLVVPNGIAAGLLVSNAASLAGLFLFYLICHERWGRGRALKALGLFICFPTAFFLSLIYSEGLFLFLAVLFAYGLQKRNLPLAALAAGLLPLTRVIGVVVVAPFALWLLQDIWQRLQPVDAGQRLAEAGSLAPRLLYLLAPFAGVAVYALYMQATTGDPLAMLHAQKFFPEVRTAGSILEPWLVLQDLFRSDQVVYGLAAKWSGDRLLFLAFLASVPLLYRRLDRPMFLFCLLMCLTPLLGSFMAYTRYVMVAFPIYMAFSGWLDQRGPRATFWVLAPMLMLQELATLMHVTNLWIA